MAPGLLQGPNFVSKIGGPYGDRTHDTRIKSPVLCQTELTARSFGEGVTTGYICNQFLADRESRGLSPLTVRFYHDKLYYVIEHITDKPFLDFTKQDIQQILMDLRCNPGGKHSYLRALRAFSRGRKKRT